MRDYRIIDAFPFNGEFDMLKMRLDYLYHEVDFFLICESTVLQSGASKIPTYESHSSLFEGYKDKIIYRIFEPSENDIEFRRNLTSYESDDRFHLENKHVDFMRDCIVGLSDDNTMIMLSGVDEFPKKELFPEIWKEVKNRNMDAVCCKMRTFYYSPICELDIDCFATTIVNNYTLVNIDRFSSLRKYAFNCKSFENAGWHLSFFHTPERILEKIKTYSHSEYNNDDIANLDNIKYRVENCLDVLDRKYIPIIKHDKIANYFPIEFYRHDIFFLNIFNRIKLKSEQVRRKKSSQQISLEIENLQLAVARQKPKVIVEIGTATGGTLARWFEIPEVETIISVDHPCGIHGGSGFEERTYVISDAVEQANISGKEFYAINGDSKDPYIINRLIELLNGRKIDFLFIDGDHTYEGVKGDFELYEQLLNGNSIVGFHDIIDSKFHSDANCFVSILWKDIKNRFDYKEFVHTELLDPVSTPSFAKSIPDGGFGGIGLISYQKKRIESPISLIIPVYNNAELTIKHLGTVLGSSQLIDEVIIYSNGSNQNENEILIKYAEGKSDLKLFIDERQVGFVKAVNESLKIAKNELILCLNSDAELFDNWESLLEPLWKDTKNGLVGPILCDEFILGCCMLFKKSVLNKVGLLNEGFGLGYFDDNEISERIKRNGYQLGYYTHFLSKDWTSSVNFPMNHIQGMSFMNVDVSKKAEQYKINEKKAVDFRNTENIKVFVNFNLDELKSLLSDKEVCVVINESGTEFEKIRFDDDIIRLANIFECTREMNIDILIDSISKGKNKEVFKKYPLKKNSKLTWLAKFDDYASMGILSQNIIEELSTDVSCRSIIGETETRNKIILDNLKKPINQELGIMFAAPDMHESLGIYKTKVIFTGVDTTGGIPNFKTNVSKADFILTPSNKSKQKMEHLGVVKPIFVFPHGIKPEVFKFRERHKTGKFNFLYVGECSDRKGIFHLLDAFLSLFKNNMEVELHIKSNNDMVFYNGEEVAKIKKENHNIVWHLSNEGHDKIIDLYNECHVYVYPSRADSFGMTLIEAMACGLPIISTCEPGSTELIEGRFYKISSSPVSVKNHPWMLGEWGEPSIDDLKFYMKSLYENYDIMATPEILKNNSDFVRTNYSWRTLVNSFESDVLPLLTKKVKIITLLTSYNRPHHIKNVINSLKRIREEGIINDIYIVENSNTDVKSEIIKIIENNIDDNFRLHVSEINMGQRGALLQMLEDVNIEEYDYIQFTDQDNEFIEPLSIYTEILTENKDIFFVTGYMSKEHDILGSRYTRHGKLFEKRAMRAGHMFLSISDFKKLLPVHLDSQYGQSHNSSWYAGLDWELTYWNRNAPGRVTQGNFILCLPGGVLHKGIDSTMFNWNVEEFEYPLQELKELRIS